MEINTHYCLDLCIDAIATISVLEQKPLGFRETDTLWFDTGLF